MKKILSIIIAVAVVLCSLNISVFAADGITTEAELEAAFAKDGDIALGGDIALTKMLTIPHGVTVTLDLNGYNITVPESTGKHIYALNNNGVLTINDTAGTGSISARGIYNGYDGSNTNATVDGSKMIVNGGTFYAMDTDGGAAIFNCAELVVNGGVFRGRVGINTRLCGVTTIENATVIGAKNSGYPVQNNGGKMTINNISITESFGAFAQYESTSETVINGGIFAPAGRVANTNHVVYQAAGDLKINGGTFIHSGNADSGSAITSCGTTTIGGNAKIIAVGDAAKAIDNYGGATITVNDGEVIGDVACQITVTGGSFTDSEVVEANSGVATQIEEPSYEALIGSTFYNTVEEAFDDAQSGDMITLCSDATIEKVITVDKNLSLNLSTYTLTTSAVTGSRVFVLGDGCTEFVLNGNGGKITSSDKLSLGILDMNNAVDVIINGGTYDFYTNNGGLFKFRNYDSSLTLNDVDIITNSQITGPNNSGNILDVNGGNFTGVTTYNAHNYNMFYIGSSAAATFDDVTIDSNYMVGVEVNGGEATLNNVNIDVEGTRGAPFNSEAANVSGGGKLTINSGNYSSKPIAETDANGTADSHGSWCVGINNSGGTLIINGGTFSNGYYGDGTPSNPREVIAVGAADANKTARLEINGGTFNSIGAIILNEWGDGTSTSSITGGNFESATKVLAGDVDGIELGISGGIFNCVIEETHCAPGYEPVYDEVTGTYGVEETDIWTYDTDAGFYVTSNDETLGMMRFLFAADTTAEIEEVGIKYIKASDVTSWVGGKEGGDVYVNEDTTVFYGDIVNIPESVKDGNYYAAAYIKVGDEYTWSEPQPCTPNWTQQFTEYNGGEQ